MEPSSGNLGFRLELIFNAAWAASKNSPKFKSGQNWPKNNHFNGKGYYRWHMGDGGGGLGQKSVTNYLNGPLGNRQMGAEMKIHLSP